MNIRNHRLAVLLFALLAAAGSLQAASPQPAADADRLMAQFRAQYDEKFPPKLKGMSILQADEAIEAQALGLRKLALTFLEKYPDDPRRWLIVNALNTESPQFVKDWGAVDDYGKPIKPVVDEQAAAAWKAKVTALQADMKKAADIPEALRKKWARRDRILGDRNAKLDAYVARRRDGRAAPEFGMRDLEGHDVKLADFRGKVVVLDFWAPWCNPCKEAMPHLQQIAEKYREQGVVVVASSTDDSRVNFQKWVRTNGAQYPGITFAYDPLEKNDARAAKKLYEVPGIPTTIIIDRAGKMVDAVVGYNAGEVIVDGALTRAGIKIDAATLAQAEADLKNHYR